MASSGILFEDQFEVKDIDPDGKKFDRVSRIFCTSEIYEMEMWLDVNTDIYPLEHQRFHLALASTLNLDGTPDEGSFDPSDRPTLADKYEYVMYGKVFKYQEESSPSLKVSVFVSFGGLLMLLKGDPRHLGNIELDSRIYLLMRKLY
eukprot:Phypoly_transcript_25755.p1 GENE.Phypoly_transcript_25755~~Phypoly_transcript_25755.p1  ORF type:complete len:169 (+),score=21.78 Phypoly_transcript_25755:68-508(+)